MHNFLCTYMSVGPTGYGEYRSKEPERWLKFERLVLNHKRQAAMESNCVHRLGVTSVSIASDETSYAYSYRRVLSELFLWTVR